MVLGNCCWPEIVGFDRQSPTAGGRGIGPRDALPATGGCSSCASTNAATATTPMTSRPRRRCRAEALTNPPALPRSSAGGRSAVPSLSGLTLGLPSRPQPARSTHRRSCIHHRFIDQDKARSIPEVTVETVGNDHDQKRAFGEEPTMWIAGPATLRPVEDQQSFGQGSVRAAKLAAMVTWSGHDAEDPPCLR